VDAILEHNVALLDNSADPHDGKPARDMAQDAQSSTIPIVAPKQVMDELSTSIEYRERQTEAKFGEAGGDTGHK
jgi:hypothetical protein